ncbi:MAG: SufD family Fe-S cluster assembly protein [Clostridia bacterium]|nr:SufD family Fe-S cluster assembly protein [Clostridia bacterium]
MSSLKLNETPVRTSRNFNINNIKLDNISVPKCLKEFKNVNISECSSKIQIENTINKIDLKYGLDAELLNQVNESSNYRASITIDSKVNKDIAIEFNFDNSNTTLVEAIDIVASEATKSTIVIRYNEKQDVEAYHNGVIRAVAKSNSNVNIIVVNMMNEKSNNFLSIENVIEDNAKINFYIVDFGGKNSITNYYANIKGKNADNKLNTIYLGKDNQLLDLNYIAELYGEKSNIDIEVQGTLKDNAKKHFKGTIDFKKGCKKATGNENENCILLSDTARSIALPMLLCSEEDVEGNHSSSAGRVAEKELFYIMTRGFNYKDAMKLMIRAKFNKILEQIKDENLRNEILERIDKRID